MSSSKSPHGRNPLSLDESIYAVLRQALEAHDTVIVDDFQLVSLIACCAPAYPRQNFLAAVLLPIAALARKQGKRLVFTAEGMPLIGLHDRFPVVSVGAFTAADYEAICASYLGDRAPAHRPREGPSVRAETERAPAAKHVRRASR